MHRGHPYRRIAVGYDASPGGRAACHWAAALARAGDASLAAIHVASPAEPHPNDLDRQSNGHGSAGHPWGHPVPTASVMVQDDLAALVRRWQRTGIACEAMVGNGKPWVELLEKSRRFNADLLVVGRHAANPGEIGFGSIPLRLMMHADVDLLLVSSPRIPTGPVLAGLDGSEASLLAVHRAARVAGSLGRSLLIAGVHVPGQANRLDRLIEQVAHGHTVDPERPARTAIWEGWFATEMPQRGRRLGAALLVAGRHGLNRGPNELIGSQVMAMALATPRAVLIVS